MNVLTLVLIFALSSISALGFLSGKRTSNRCRIQIPHGSQIVKPRIRILGGTVKRGTRIFYRCKKGFKLQGRRAITCLRRGWSQPPPRCVAKGCKDPGEIANGVIIGGSGRWTEDDFVTIICHAGFDLIGADVMTCLESGSWTPKPECLKTDPLKRLKTIAKELKENFVDKFALVTQDSRGRAGLSGSAAGLDLVFVIDNSRSVGATNFEKGKDFVKEMIKSFGVSRHKLGTRVAVVSFDKKADLLLSLDDETLNSTQAATDKIDKEVNYIGGGTHTATALLKVINDVVPTSREKSKKALFLITDGKSNTNQEPGDKAQQLRGSYGYECYAIGIGDEADEKELNSVASEPFRSHVFMLKNFDDLQDLTQLINGSKTDYTQCGIAGDTQTRLNKTVGRIVGGIIAKPGAWPWQAMIIADGSFRCSGALLDDQWVVTAAHCFDDGVKAEDLDVVLGEHDRATEEGSEMREFVSQLIRYPDHKAGSLDYDIALLKLESPIKLTAFARPVCLPLKHDGIELSLPGKTGMVTGWGATTQVNQGQFAGPSAMILRQVAVPFVSRRTCEQSTSEHLPITENMFCAGTGAGDVDACTGDSGGPLVGRRSTDEWVLMGLVSWGEGCARKGKYGVYTKVTKFVSWIEITRLSN